MKDEKDGELKKRIDESWKETVDKEKDAPKEPGERPIEAGFNMFISALMMETLVALGEVENPITKKKEFNKDHARFLIDTLAMLKDKTRNNLAKDESDSLEAVLYDLRMRFVDKTR